MNGILAAFVAALVFALTYWRLRIRRKHTRKRLAVGRCVGAIRCRATEVLAARAAGDGAGRVRRGAM
jgi:riboflavin transporter FmnP